MNNELLKELVLPTNIFLNLHIYHYFHVLHSILIHEDNYLYLSLMSYDNIKTNRRKTR